MSDEGYELEYVKEAFTTNWIAPLGPNVSAFEREFAETIGTREATLLLPVHRRFILRSNSSASERGFAPTILTHVIRETMSCFVPH